MLDPPRENQPTTCTRPSFRGRENQPILDPPFFFQGTGKPANSGPALLSGDGKTSQFWTRPSFRGREKSANSGPALLSGDGKTSQFCTRPSFRGRENQPILHPPFFQGTGKISPIRSPAADADLPELTHKLNRSPTPHAANLTTHSNLFGNHFSNDFVGFNRQIPRGRVHISDRILFRPSTFEVPA